MRRLDDFVRAVWPLGGRRLGPCRLVEQRHDAIDQLGEPLERRQQHGRRLPSQASEPHLPQPPGSSPAAYRVGTTSAVPAYASSPSFVSCVTPAPCFNAVASTG